MACCWSATNHYSRQQWAVSSGFFPLWIKLESSAIISASFIHRHLQGRLYISGIKHAWRYTASLLKWWGAQIRISSPNLCRWYFTDRDLCKMWMWLITGCCLSYDLNNGETNIDGGREIDNSQTTLKSFRNVFDTRLYLIFIDRIIFSFRYHRNIYYFTTSISV